MNKIIYACLQYQFIDKDSDKFQFESLVPKQGEMAIGKTWSNRIHCITLKVHTDVSGNLKILLSRVKTTLGKK